MDIGNGRGHGHGHGTWTQTLVIFVVTSYDFVIIKRINSNSKGAVTAKN
jgi:hypothetical protein